MPRPWLPWKRQPKTTAGDELATGWEPSAADLKRLETRIKTRLPPPKQAKPSWPWQRMAQSPNFDQYFKLTELGAIVLGGIAGGIGLWLAHEANEQTRDQFYHAQKAALFATLYDRREECANDPVPPTVVPYRLPRECPLKASPFAREQALRSLSEIWRRDLSSTIPLHDLQMAHHTHLEHINLKRTDLNRAQLEGAVLYKAQLECADLSETHLEGADLRGANLKSADLKGAQLENTDLRNANLKDADLRGAKLDGAHLCTDKDSHGYDLPATQGLTQAQLNEACGDENTCLPDDLIIPLCAETSWAR